eukprot:1045578-Rhodomonas_salina.1
MTATSCASSCASGLTKSLVTLSIVSEMLCGPNSPTVATARWISAFSTSSLRSHSPSIAIACSIVAVCSGDSVSLCAIATCDSECSAPLNPPGIAPNG